MSMVILIAVFITGVALGLAIYRYIMIGIIGTLTPDACDFCQWQIKKLESKEIKKKLL